MLELEEMEHYELRERRKPILYIFGKKYVMLKPDEIDYSESEGRRNKMESMLGFILFYCIVNFFLTIAIFCSANQIRSDLTDIERLVVVQKEDNKKILEKLAICTQLIRNDIDNGYMELDTAIRQIDFTPKDNEEEVVIEELNAETVSIPEEAELLARLVIAEAGNQGETGMAYVADVVLNRVDDPDFPSTIKEVIYQPGQFTKPYSGSDEAWLSIAREVVHNEIQNRQSNDILWFNTGEFLPYGMPIFQYGDHYFSGKE